MQFVEKGVFPPHVCAITGRSDGPLIDTLAEINHNYPVDPHVYISPGWVTTCAKKLFAMVDQADYEAVCHERDTLKAQLAEADKLIEAADLIKKRRGRKAKE